LKKFFPYRPTYAVNGYAYEDEYEDDDIQLDIERQEGQI
jgi:hypothetical protein